MQSFNLLIKSSDTRTTFYCRQFQFTNYNLKSAITNTRPGPNILIYACICRGNPIGRQQRNPIWGLAQPPGPYIPSSQPQKPEACLKTCYNAATQAQTEYLKGRSRRLPLRGQPQNCPWLVPRSQVPCPLSQDPCPVSHVLRLAGRQGQADYLFMQHL